jgi:hypothetical protein
MAKLSPLESQARDLIEANRDADPDFSSHRQMVRNVFLAMWSSALTVDCIEKMAAAMHSQIEEPNLKPTLKAFVKAKLLRSRMNRGVRIYELNLK